MAHVLIYHPEPVDNSHDQIALAARLSPFQGDNVNPNSIPEKLQQPPGYYAVHEVSRRGVTYILGQVVDRFKVPSGKAQTAKGDNIADLIEEAGDGIIDLGLTPFEDAVTKIRMGTQKPKIYASLKEKA